MNIHRLSLSNFKCFSDITLSVGDGVTVIHGVNGSGKSSLLEGIFFSLYGSNTLDARTLDEVITTGEREATIELSFSQDGRSYDIVREIVKRDDRASTRSCTLTPHDSDGSIEGARSVREYITELLRMDADAFLNCAYVRQGEVNTLIHATPSERQSMIDDLLQLGLLEEYRDRTRSAKLGIKTVLDGQREVHASLEEQIDDIDRSSLLDRINELHENASELDEEIERYEQQKEQATAALERAESALERYEQSKDEIERLSEEIETIRSEITEAEATRESLHDRLRKAREERSELEDERNRLIDDLDCGERSLETFREETESTSTAMREDIERFRLEISEMSSSRENHRTRIEELQQERTNLIERMEDLSEAIRSARANLGDREESLTSVEAKIDRRRSTFEDVPIEIGDAVDHRNELRDTRESLRSNQTDVLARIESTEASLAEAHSLLDDGKCPTCGQDIDEETHVDAVSELTESLEILETKREDIEDDLSDIESKLERADSMVETERELKRLEDRRESITELIEESTASIDDKVRQRDELEERIEDVTSTLEERQQRVSELEEELEPLRRRLGRLNVERQSIHTVQERIDRIDELDAELADLDAELERIRERRSNLESVNEERRQRVSEKRERLRDLEGEFDTDRIETLEEEREKATEYLEQVTDKLRQLRTERDEIRSELGAAENQLSSLDDLESRAERIRQRMDRLESLYDQGEQLETAYGAIRKELRQGYVTTLERLINETFRLVYRNDSYQSIELDDEYRLTVYQKDGTALDPTQLSGGERALFNLSLRCAIYRLIAEGVGGSAPLPPLILDEPTVFLDSGHVTRLLSLVDAMCDIGVEQIVLVSHDEELVGAADHLIRVEKDPTSNRSTVSTERAISRQLSAVDG